MAPVPYLSYRDAAAAIDWLAAAFGFEKTQAYDGPDGKVMHAEMSCGGGSIMLGTGDSPGQEAPMASTESPRNHGVYVVVEDLDSHFERGKAAGATVVYPPQDTEFGTRRYRVLDPEGYEWSFGTYAPGGGG